MLLNRRAPTAVDAGGVVDDRVVQVQKDSAWICHLISLLGAGTPQGLRNLFVETGKLLTGLRTAEIRGFFQLSQLFSKARHIV